MYIILEYCPNGELFHILKNGGLGPDITLFFFKQIIEALQFINQNGFIHGDLKPENILISKDFSIKIIDFQLEAKNEKNALIYGTEQYLSPEARNGRNCAETDLFVAGMLLFIMYVGCPPFNKAQNDDLFFYTFCNDREQFWNYFEKRRPLVKFTHEFKEVVEGLLELDIEKRWTFSRVSESVWAKQSLDEEKVRESVRILLQS
jgi:serine/threonine protein kinase